MRGLVLVVALLVAGTAAAEVDPTSANYVMLGCRQAIIPGNFQNPMLQDICFGRVAGVWDMAQTAGWVCGPNSTILEQALRIVVQYVDARPARMHERFTTLALEALRAAWPCK